MDLFNLHKLKNAFSDYLKTKIELLKLDVKEYMAEALAQVIAYVVILMMLSLVMAFSSIGVSFLLNEVLDSTYLGFLITAGFYLLILLIVVALLKTGRLRDFFEKQLMAENKPEEDED